MSESIVFEESSFPLSGQVAAAVPKDVAPVQLVTEPVAKLWCRSFGISSPAAVERLQYLLEAGAEEGLAAGLPFDRLQSLLDRAAEKIIRDWFGTVLARDIPASGKALAIIRLAFLDCNYDGKWSESFLSNAICVQELAADLESFMIEPTPCAVPRAMVRQTI